MLNKKMDPAYEPEHLTVNVEVVIFFSFMWEHEGYNREQTRKMVSDKIGVLGIDPSIYIRYDHKNKEYHIRAIISGDIDCDEVWGINDFDEIEPFDELYEFTNWLDSKLSAEDIYGDMWDIEILNLEVEPV